MKITSASKKVLASALSAAMVIAFAPTAAFGATDTIETKDCDDAAMAALGYVAKVFQPTTKVGYKYYKASEMTDAESYVLISDIVVDGTTLTTLTLADGTAIDMAGHTIKASADNVNPVTAAGDLTVKNGTIEATGKKSVAIVDGSATSDAETVKLTDVNVSGKAAALDGDNEITIKNGTYGAITATSVTVDGTVETKAIAAEVTMSKNAALTVVNENAVEHANDDTDGCNAATAVTKNAATGIAGDVNMDEGATVTVTATSKAGVATAIAGNVVGAKKATVNATAKAIANGQPAMGIAGDVDFDDEGATVNVTAVSADMAYGIYSAMGATDSAEINAGTVSAEGMSDAKSFAVYLSDGATTPTLGAIALGGGSFTGKIVAAKTAGSITAGKYSVDPSDYVNKASYDVSKASDGMYVVQKFTDFAITGKGAATADVVNYVKAAAQQMVKGETPAGIQLAEGVTTADFVAQAEKGLKVNVKISTYNEKNATDEQKAAKTAVDEAIKANLNKVTDPNWYQTISITLEYDKSGQVEPVVMGTVTALGQIPNGLNTKQAVLEIGAGTQENPAGAYYAVNGGKAAKVDWATNIDGKPVNKIELTAVPTLLAFSVVDTEAVKDAAQKGEEAAETITDPAVLAMITALQDENAAMKAAGASKTVKLGAKKTKLAKAKSVTLKAIASTSGATMSFKKASGSAKITVAESGKATLKAGVKRGTYKATVTATVGASSKNVTVKFVIK